MTQTIISGGQTGADQAGLRAAKRSGLNTGGWMPLGFRTEDGPMPSFAELYGMTECDSREWHVRTRLNVLLADATVIFGKRSRGSNLTEALCQAKKKPVCWVFLPPEHAGTSKVVKARPQAFRLWLELNRVTTLNVSGNRESVNPGIGHIVEEFLVEVFR